MLSPRTFKTRQSARKAIREAHDAKFKRGRIGITYQNVSNPRVVKISKKKVF